MTPSTLDTLDLFEAGAHHEQVVFCNDAATGLRAIIAIHSTALGPALGGTRFYPYVSTSDALADVLDLSRGMSYKAALAGLDLGGGKAVILGDPGTDKSEALLRAYGRFVQSLNGRYCTACDVGTYSEDMDVIARECSHVTGRTTAHGGAGDSSVLTAYGVFQGMRAAATVAWGSDSLAGRIVGVSGVGKVGRHLVRHLIEDGASVVVTDVHQPSIDRVLDEFPQVTVAASTEELVASASTRCRTRCRPTLPTPETPTVRPASESVPQATVAAARMPWKTPYAVSTELSPAPPWAVVRPVT